MNFENFSFFVIVVLFLAGNVKKIEKYVVIVLIATIGGIQMTLNVHVRVAHVHVSQNLSMSVYTFSLVPLWEIELFLVILI